MRGWGEGPESRGMVRQVSGLLMALALVVSVGFLTDLRGQEPAFTIQVASVPTPEEARLRLEELRKRGIAGYAVLVDIPGIGQRYRIRYGRFRTAVLAKAAAEREVGRGAFTEFIVSREEAAASGGKAKQAQPVRQPDPLPKPAGKVTETPAVMPAAKLAVKLAKVIEGVKPPVTPPVTPPATLPATLPVKPTPNPVEKPPGSEVPPAVPAPKAPNVPNTPKAPELARPMERGPARKLPEMTVIRGRWEMIDPRTLPEARWRSLHFIDSLTGWIGGDGGQLYRTSDGGRSWRPVVSGAVGTIMGITFPDWNRGWVLARAGGTEGATVLHVTRNGGRTWKRVELPGVARVYRVDGMQGWAIGDDSLLMRTVDGGETWSRSSAIPATLSGSRIDFEDLVMSTSGIGGMGWIIGNIRAENRHRIGGVWKTVDGGRSWKELALPSELLDRQGQGSAGGPAGKLLSVRFFSTSAGVITGELGEPAGGGGRSWFTLETADGGQSWKLAVQSGRELERASFSPALVNTATTDSAGNSGPAGFNGQHAWTWTSTIEADETGGATHIETHLIVTRDGGRTWTEELKLIGRHNLIGYIPGANRGWVITERGLVITSRE